MELSWRMQIASGARIVFRPDAVIRHRHRRTLRALWRHGRQHGRGVAFMKSVYPDRYRIRPGEQVGRVGAIGREALRALTGSGAHARDASGRNAAAGSREPRRDRFLAPIFLTIWYGGMAAGYLMGPAWSGEHGANPRRSR
jgi:cellulose synthase/poly-beta-1,6-N-acetylglucosamine synthase-like glycosyltransferase